MKDSKIIAVLSVIIILCSIIFAKNNIRAAEIDVIFYAEQYRGTPLAQMTAADDTSDVGRVKSMSHNHIGFHLIVSAINDSCHYMFQGSVDGAESTYTNLDLSDVPTKITKNGSHVFEFTSASLFYYYRYIWVSESGGTDAITSAFITLGRDWKD